MHYLIRFGRLTAMLVRRDIGIASFRDGLHPSQKAVLRRAGGVAFCDARDEKPQIG